MSSRERVLAHLARDHRVAGLTAGEALVGISHSMSSLLLQQDRHFFRSHADDPCHEVARACSAGHIWHGDENRY